MACVRSLNEEKEVLFSKTLLQVNKYFEWWTILIDTISYVIIVTFWTDLVNLPILIFKLIFRVVIAL